MKLRAYLKKLNACGEAVEWVGDKSLPVAWKTCERGDWLLWFAARCGTDRKVLVRGACACARTALKYVPKGEDRPLKAIQTAERWCRGKATEDECRAASAYAADAAAAAAACKRMAKIVRRIVPMPKMKKEAK